MTDQESKLKEITEREFDLAIQTNIRSNLDKIRELMEHNELLVDLYNSKELEKNYDENRLRFFEEDTSISYKIESRRCGFG